MPSKLFRHTLILTGALVASTLALPVWADDIPVYEVDPGTGPAALASGTFTFDLTTDTITSWDISVVDGGTSTLFENGKGESSSYGLSSSSWDARFSAGGMTYLDFYFASPGLNAIANGPATVTLLSKSNENIGGVKAQIDNPSVSVIPELGTEPLLIAGLGLVGLARRRRSEVNGVLVPV